MNLAENIFKLSDIEIGSGKIEFVISLCCNDNYTQKIYLNNYFEGVFIEIRKEKYNLFAKIENERLSAEILCDTVLSNISTTNGDPMRLWVRLRIGNMVIEQPVGIGKKPFFLPISHSNPCIFTPVSDYKFTFQRKPSDCLTADTAFSSEKKILCKKIEITDSDVKLTLLLPADFDNSSQNTGSGGQQLCLIWYDADEKHDYYFHSMPCNTSEIIYAISREEIDLFNFINTKQKIFELKMFEKKGAMYEITFDGGSDFEQCTLPASDFYAHIFAENGFLKVNMTNYLVFEIFGMEKDHITFQYHKRSYHIEILEIISHRVNTDLEYSLPFEIADDNESSVLLNVHLLFSEKEKLFRTGVYQFWALVKDDIETNRILLKINCQKALTENTYIISQTPYTVIGRHFYSCFFYNDTAGTLKCNIIPKMLKSEIKVHYIENGSFCWTLSLCKEPFFDREIRIVTETEDGFKVHFGQKIIYENEMRTDFLLQADIDYLCKEITNGVFCPFAVIERMENVKIPLQNNFKNVPAAGRETQKFCEIFTTENGEYRRIWGDHKKDAYMFGVSDDLQFCEFEKIDFNDDSVVLTAKLNINFEIEPKSVSFVLKNELDKEEIAVQSVAADSVLTAKIDVNDLNAGEYNVFAITDNGMKSSLALRNVPGGFCFYNQGKKLLPQKKDDSLLLSVQEILLFENPEKAKKCLHIVKDALKNGSSKKRIWLVGENLGLSARDNGLAFFEYCMAHKSPNEEVYFVTKDKNKDLDNLSQYMDNVVMYDSDEHIRLDALAEFYIVSHGIRDVMPSLYHNQIGVYKKPVVYLQHGITAMKVIGIDNKSYGGCIRKFIVSSEFEKRLLIKSRQFWDYELAVTGFSRYDKLDVSKTDGGYIWIMPTWRDWLAFSPREFANSEFCIYYRKLLSDKRLLKLLREKNCKIVFSLHIEFEKFKLFFEDLENDVVEITDMHQKAICDRIRECKMMVTDYSSIIFDVVYLNKPALFFQFDRDTYDLYRGSYINMEKELPGKVAEDYETLVESLMQTVNSGFKIPEQYLQRRKKFFDYEDARNSERIYKTLLALREEMADEH